MLRFDRQLTSLALTATVMAFGYQVLGSQSTQAQALNGGVTLAQGLKQSNAAAGRFTGVAYDTHGAAQIVEVDGQKYLEFDDEFQSNDGPDLFVLLHTDAEPETYGPEQYVNLGRLQAVEGTQRYAIPEGVTVSDFQSAVIWCRQFDVTFGFATL